MWCHHDVCHLGKKSFLDIIEEHLSTIPLKSGNLDADRIMSFVPDSKEIMMVKRSDIACCIDDPDPLIRYLTTHRVSRQVCDAFYYAGEEFQNRWKEYRR